jgi:hypothetical protein
VQIARALQGGDDFRAHFARLFQYRGGQIFGRFTEQVGALHLGKVDDMFKNKVIFGDGCMERHKMWSPQIGNRTLAWVTPACYGRF